MANETWSRKSGNARKRRCLTTGCLIASELGIKTRNVLRMTMKRKIIMATAAGIALAIVVCFHSSWTQDRFVCHSCKGFGQSTAFRVFRHPVIWTPIRLTRSITGKDCKHSWEWYFANSHGICFNSRGDWDGPIGTYPYHEELERQHTENQASQPIAASAAQAER